MNLNSSAPDERPPAYAAAAVDDLDLDTPIRQRSPPRPGTAMGEIMST